MTSIESRTPTSEAYENMLGPSQLAILESLATFDPSNPSHDEHTAVAARYVLEQQLARGLALPSSSEHGLLTYSDYQLTLKNKTREARLTSLLKERLQKRASPLPSDTNDFDGFMAHYAATGVEKTLREQHKATVEQQVFEAIAQVGANLSSEQVAWEVNHGTVSRRSHEDLHILESQGEKTVDAAIRAAQKTLGRQPERSMTPAALAEAIGYPAESAGTIISELVTNGVLKRNTAENTVSLDAKFQPRGLRTIAATALRALTEKAPS